MTSKTALKSFLIATLVALGTRFFIFEQFRISSNSMSPNLLKGDLVLVSKSAFSTKLPFTSIELFQTGQPARSDIVAFSVPERGTDTYVKRIVALGGDRVEIKEGVLWINGEMAQYMETSDSEIEESWPAKNTYRIKKAENPMPDYGPVDIPKGYFFALGDNRLDSVDSRTWGPIPYSCLKGKVALIWLSVGSSGDLRPQRWLSTVQ